MSGSEPIPLFQDIHLIAPMVTYLGKFDRTPRAAKQINEHDDIILGGKYKQPKHYYSCKHFDPKAKLCTIYEMRPAMCRNYPNGHECNYVGCTWLDNKAKKETPKKRRERLRVLQEAETKKNDPGGGEKDKAQQCAV